MLQRVQQFSGFDFPHMRIFARTSRHHRLAVRRKNSRGDDRQIRTEFRNNLAGTRVPNARRTTMSCEENPVSIGAVCQHVDLSWVLEPWAGFASGSHVPKAGGRFV